MLFMRNVLLTLESALHIQIPRPRLALDPSLSEEYVYFSIGLIDADL